MAGTLIDRQIENAVQSMFGNKAVRIVKSIGRMAEQQGGDSIIDNYRLLGKRALVAFGVVIVAVEVTTSVVSFVISRKGEEQRVERIVRRVLEEERQKDEDAVKTEAPASGTGAS